MRKIIKGLQSPTFKKVALWGGILLLLYVGGVAILTCLRGWMAIALIAWGLNK
ncbi:MAG: hypothetical protein J6Y37_05895 [Paludibacteraceae bacterium]|nr:hypothetical protein [Paludibacteraceae bacterium]